MLLLQITLPLQIQLLPVSCHPDYSEVPRYNPDYLPFLRTLHGHSLLLQILSAHSRNRFLPHASAAGFQILERNILKAQLLLVYTALLSPFRRKLEYLAESMLSQVPEPEGFRVRSGHVRFLRVPEKQLHAPVSVHASEDRLLSHQQLHPWNRLRENGFRLPGNRAHGFQPVRSDHTQQVCLFLLLPVYPDFLRLQ